MYRETATARAAAGTASVNDIQAPGESVMNSRRDNFLPEVSAQV
jgi:hypothetical protein